MAPGASMCRAGAGARGYYGLMVRNLLVEETRKDYVLLHKSQGIPREKILRRYCMKNILPGMIPAMTMAVPHILGGTYVVEMVFGYPGLGTLAFESALYKDFNVLMAVTLLTGAWSSSATCWERSSVRPSIRE